MNVKNYTEMAVNQEYIKKLSGIRYKLNTCNMTKPKDKDKAQTKGQAKIVYDYKFLGRT